jgi:uncharacterized membrane protein YdjX (TVP38/TMEM64 family)
VTISPRKIRAAVLLLLLALLALAAWLLPVEQLLETVQRWTLANPGAAALTLVGLLAAGILMMLPASLLFMLAGFLFGLGQGFALTWLAGFIASTLAFLAGRTLARPWVERRLRRQATFMAIDRTIRRKDLLVVLHTRLVMVLPYPPLNYTLGLTAVSLRQYVIGTNLGMILPMFLFVYLGSTASDLAAIARGEVRLDGMEWLLGMAALAAVVVTVALIVRSAGRVLKEELISARATRPQQPR